MLVLDEQLMGRSIENDLIRWYRGSIRFINDLRPGTVIKDDAIPALLRQQSQATFLTINVTDFWQVVAIDASFCIVCFTMPDSRANEIATLLRTVFRIPLFSTKTRRMGKVLRVTQSSVSYYTHRDRKVQTIPL